MDVYTEPGFHFKLPYLTTVADVQTTLQTDVVRDIPCGTSGGVLIYFDKIEVVNRLDKAHALRTIKDYGVDYDKVWIFDKIHHEINQFCSSHTLQEVYIDQFSDLDENLASALQKDCDKYDTGLSIIAIRVTKPKIPTAVLRNYEAVEEQKTKLKVSAEEMKVVRNYEETEQMRATIQANREAEVARINAEKQATVSKITVERELLEKEGQRKLAEVANQMLLDKEKALADAEFYKKQSEAKSMEKLLTPEYLQYTLFQALANNTKIYFGEKIPTMFSLPGDFPSPSRK